MNINIVGHERVFTTRVSEVNPLGSRDTSFTQMVKDDWVASLMLRYSAYDRRLNPQIGTVCSFLPR